MPFGDFEDFDACVAGNSDKRDPEAYCAAIKRQIEGAAALSESEREAIRASDAFGERMLEEDPCEDGWVMVGTKQQNGRTVPNCVPEEDADPANLAAADDRCPEGHVQIGDACVEVESVDAPASLLSTPRVMASASPLDTQPIEREELGDDRVAYRGLKLIDSGVWTDSNSETATLYDARTFENTDAEFDPEFDGPPVNIAHDIHKDGPDAGEPHAASIAGYIDAESIATDGDALFGDVILNTADAAGDFADENLKSALENDGTAGFSPSVELMPTDTEPADHPRAEEYVAGAELTGLGLVRDPASKSVDLAHETRSRSVALAASDAEGNPTPKALYRKDDDMSQKQLMAADEVRETLDMFGFDGLDEMTDDEVMDMAEDLHGDLMGALEGDDEGEDAEMAEHGDDMDEEDDEEEEMAAGDGELDALMDTVSTLESRLEDLEDRLSNAATESELADVKAELADADTVAEVDERLKTLESQEKDRKTLADGREEDDDIDWADADGGITYDSATGSMSR